MDAYIVSAVRTPVGKAPRGSLREVSPVELAATAVREAVARVPGLDPGDIDDLVLGCAMPEGSQGLNVARHVALAAGLPVSTSAMTVNRFCASGLQALAIASAAITTGSAGLVVAGGVESMSAVPMIGWHFDPDRGLAGGWPNVFLSMGLTAEAVARRFGVSREDQDAWALRSHERAAAAIDRGDFEAETVPVTVRQTIVEDGRPRIVESVFRVDEGVRRDTDAAKLAALRAVFAEGGTVTAGNSSQMSDGAAALVVASEAWVRRLGLTPLGRLVAFATAGVDPEIMGIGPVEAVPKALRLAGLSLGEIEVVELNEAFAAQVLAVVRALDLDEAKTNPNGGAIALGHPLGATGAKLSVQVLHELARRGGRYGLVTMCVGGGQGAAGILEWLGGEGRPGRSPDDGSPDDDRSDQATGGG